jgi:hypothetical protein
MTRIPELTAGPYRSHDGEQITVAREKKSTHQTLVKREHNIGNKGMAITEDNKRGVGQRRLVFVQRLQFLTRHKLVGTELQTPVYNIVIQARESN